MLRGFVPLSIIAKVFLYCKKSERFVRKITVFCIYCDIGCNFVALNKYFATMNFLDILFLAVALAMDCFSVSVVTGVILRQWRGVIMLRMAFFFGLFQAVMPWLGWMAMNRFSYYIEAFDHWLAFGLLAFLGGRMVKGSFEPEEERTFDPSRLRTQLTLAVATSIDALAVGITFSCIGYNSFAQMAMPLAIIGLVSLVFSLLGNGLGIRFGRTIERRLKPELLGGVILILIGVKVLLSHLL